MSDLPNLPKAAALSQTAGVADGWRLVPVEPTEAMIAAGSDHANNFDEMRTRIIYVAMLAAAPAASGGDDGLTRAEAIAEFRSRTAASESYAKANPLGGPATMFDTIAYRLRAGEPMAEVLEDYGLRFSSPANASVSERAREIVPVGPDGGWCTRCGCGNDAANFAHLPSCNAKTPDAAARAREILIGLNQGFIGCKRDNEIITKGNAYDVFVRGDIALRALEQALTQQRGESSVRIEDLGQNAPLGHEERADAEQAYTLTAFDYESAQIGSRDWSLYWRGWWHRSQLYRATPPAQRRRGAGVGEAGHCRPHEPRPTRLGAFRSGAC